MMKGRILITGASGFLGGDLASYFQGRGWEVVGMVTRPGALPSGIAEWEMRLPDGGLGGRLRSWRPDWCFHCAGSSQVVRSVLEPGLDYEANVVATRALYEELERESPSTRVIFFSSAAVYGQPARLPIDGETLIRPISPYGEHKWMCEEMGKRLSARGTVGVINLRIFSAYGPGLRKQVLWDLARQVKGWKQGENSEIVLHGTGEERRDFVHVADIRRGVERLMDRGEYVGESYNVATGESWTIREVAEGLLKRMGVDGRVLRFLGDRAEGVPTSWSVDRGSLAWSDWAWRKLDSGLNDYAEWLRSLEGGRDADRFLAVAG